MPQPTLPANDNPAPAPVRLVPIVGVIVDDGRVILRAPPPRLPADLFPADPREA